MTLHTHSNGGWDSCMWGSRHGLFLGPSNPPCGALDTACHLNQVTRLPFIGIQNKLYLEPRVNWYHWFTVCLSTNSFYFKEVWKHIWMVRCCKGTASGLMNLLENAETAFWHNEGKVMEYFVSSQHYDDINPSYAIRQRRMLATWNQCPRSRVDGKELLILWNWQRWSKL